MDVITASSPTFIFLKFLEETMHFLSILNVTFDKWSFSAVFLKISQLKRRLVNTRNLGMILKFTFLRNIQRNLPETNACWMWYQMNDKLRLSEVDGAKMLGNLHFLNGKREISPGALKVKVEGRQISD